MAAKVVWGLDIGNSALKAVKMERQGAECKVVDFDIISIAGEDDKDRASRIQAAFSTLTQNHKFGNDPVFISVPGNVCLHREFQLPPGSEDRLADLVMYEAKQQIPFPLEQVEWGYERFEDPSGVGVALIAVRKNDIQDLLNTATANKLNIRGITAAPMALFNFVQFEFKPESTTLILDAGSKGTDFVVMNKRQIYFRTIQIAGREITRQLENKFKVPFEKAEELKVNIEKSPQMDKILAVIEPTLRQLGAEVQRTIGFYKSKARGQRIQQAYLLGHTFRLPKMAEFLQAQVREAPFALVEGLQRIRLDVSINPDAWSVEFPTMAVAMGLGVQGLGLSELTLNLIGKQTEAAATTSKWKGWAAACVAAIAATLVFSYLQASSAEAEYTVNKDKLKASIEDANTYAKQEKAAIATISEREDLAKRFARVGSDRGKIAQFFPKLVGLKGSDGRALFSAENKMFLTGLYVSRAPYGSLPGIQADRNDKTSGREALDKSDNLTGPKSIYNFLGKNVTDPLIQPAETRTSLPLMGLLIAEIETGPDLLGKITRLEDALRRLEEVKEIETTHEDGSKVTEKFVKVERPELSSTFQESILEYDSQGRLKTGPTNPSATPSATPAEPKKKQYTVIYAMVRLEDKTDADLEPAVKAEAPKAPSKAGKSSPK